MRNITDNIYISSGKYRLLDDGVTTECTIDCRINLNEIERQYLIFTRSFIKNKLSRRIPVVYSIYSFDHKTGMHVCRAKYLLRPFDGKALVMYIDRDYYSGECLPDDRSIIPKRNVFKPNAKKSEYSDYAYTETITVTASAKCNPDDVFDVETGKTVSRMKAVKKALKMVCGLYRELTRHAISMSVDIYYTQTGLLESINQLNEMLSKFTETNGI